jgi:hypothetical protein
MGKLVGLLLMLVVFSSMVLAITNFYASTGETYEQNISNISYLNKTEQIRITIEEMQNRTSDTPGVVETAAFIAFGAIDVFKLGFQSVDVVTTIAHDAADPAASGHEGMSVVPAWAAVLIGVVLTLILLGVIWGAWSKHDV